MIKIINYFVQSILIYTFFLTGRVLGLKISRKLFSFLFSLIGPFFKSDKVIEKNLSIYSPKISSLEREEIVKGMWKNYGVTFIEYIFLDYFRNTRTHLNTMNTESLSKIFNEKKPVIFISGHFANFELMSMEITKKISL